MLDLLDDCHFDDLCKVLILACELDVEYEDCEHWTKKEADQLLTLLKNKGYSYQAIRAGVQMRWQAREIEGLDV